MPDTIANSIYQHLPALGAMLAAYGGIRFQRMWLGSEQAEALLGLSLALIFPWPVALGILAFWIFGSAILTRLNDYKIALNGMPVTWNDIAITSKNPAVLLHLFGLSPRLWLSLAGATLFTAIVALVWFAASGGLWRDASLAGLLLGLASCALWIALARCYREKLYADVVSYLSQTHFPFGESRNSLGWELQLWDHEAIAELSRHLGVPGFIVYTSSLSSVFEAPVFRSKDDAQQSAIEAAPVSRLIERRMDAAGPSPNIVMLQLESGLNPNWAFRLKQEFQSSLFSRGPHSRILAPLRTNIVGGGSWVSEFEALVGIDARAFGYLGYYAHTSVAPFVAGGLPRRLVEAGYKTSAYYPATGDFYNTRAAYGNYGFQHFFDSRDLALQEEWHSTDEQLVRAALQHIKADCGAPQFHFLVTNGMHSPYKVRRLRDEHEANGFVDSNDPALNGQLRTYLRLLKAAESAVDLIVERLERMQSETGRPYVLIIYGDHQPHAFTATSQVATADFDSVRTDAPVNETFVHLISSDASVQFEDVGVLPVALMPTLLSAYAMRPPTLYANFNLSMLERFGANFLPNYSFGGEFGTPDGVAGIRPREAQDGSRSPVNGDLFAAQAQYFRDVRRSGILKPT